MMSSQQSDVIADSQQDVVVTPAERLIMAKLNNNGEKMDRITGLIESMESTIFNLQKENECLKKELAEVRSKQEAIQSVANVVSIKTNKAYDRSNFNEQYSRNYNLRIYFVDEPEGETAKQCEEAVLKLFHEKLELRNIKSSDLDAVHRLGKKADNKPRGIIVRFVSRRTREEVISQRKKLKKRPGQTSKAVVIVEDLTKDNYVLYNRARATEAAKECWTKMGKIFVKSHSGTVTQIKQVSDIVNFEAQHAPQGVQNSQQGGSGSRNHRQYELYDKSKQNASGWSHSRRGRAHFSGGRGRGAVRGQSQKQLRESRRESHSPMGSDGEWFSQNDSDKD
jgi:hypothetical protein